jgi:hypothetical protein
MYLQNYIADLGKYKENKKNVRKNIRKSNNSTAKKKKKKPLLKMRQNIRTDFY